MKFQVHCQKESFFTPKSICVYLLMFVLCIILILTMAPDEPERMFLVTTMIIVYLVTFLLLGGETFCHEKLNYLILDEDIRFFATTGTNKKKTYQYSDIKAIFIDECPMEYIQREKFIGRGYSQRTWTALYGKYIIAVDKENIVLFVCSYQQVVWDTLIMRCKDSLEYIMNEEEYAAFKIERNKLKNQIERETVERGLEQYYRMNGENC